MAFIKTSGGTIELFDDVLKILDANAVKALEQSAEALRTEVIDAQVIPRDENTLQEQTYVDYSEATQGTVRIVSNTPYARRLYFHPEYNFRKTRNKNAGGKWFEEWLDGKFVTEAFKKIYGGML